MSVRSNCPVSAALMRKYVDSSMGHCTPRGTKTNEPSEKTALLSAAKKLSLYGTTEPRYLRTSSGCSRTASPKEQKMIPCFASSSLYVVPTLTLSNTASTATPERRFCSLREIPSLLYVSSSFGSTSSSDASGFVLLGAE